MVGFAILAPMLWPQILPRTTLITSLLPPVPTARREPAAERPVITKASYHVPRVFNGAIYEPTHYPDKAAAIIDPPEDFDSGGVVGGVPHLGPGGGDSGLLGAILNAGGPPPPKPVVVEARQPAPPAAPTVVRRFNVGGVVKMATVLHRVEPEYPSIAKQAHVSGVVELVGVIGVDGHLKDLKLVSGHPLLVRAAMQAVSQWIYSPTRLNGEPVEVIAPITVTFKLN
jgi:protein TonB